MSEILDDNFTVFNIDMCKILCEWMLQVCKLHVWGTIKCRITTFQISMTEECLLIYMFPRHVAKRITNQHHAHVLAWCNPRDTLPIMWRNTPYWLRTAPRHMCQSFNLKRDRHSAYLSSSVSMLFFPWVSPAGLFRFKINLWNYEYFKTFR
jgi:hypothetical protein